MNKISWLVGLLLVCASGAAQAVPSTINFTGRLTTSSGPVNGNVSVTFRIFDQFTGGNQEWTETHASLAADNGLVYADLGSLTTLTPAVLDGTVKYLEIVVNADVLTPRVAINSVPYSMRAGTSEMLGDLTPTDVVTTVNTANGIAASRSGSTVTVGLATTSCGTNQIYKYSGGTWSCQDDKDTTYSAGTGINIATGTISLATTGCSTGYVWKYSGGVFSCQADATPAAGNGIMVSGTTVSLNTTGCSNGYVWKYSGGTFSCQADATPIAGNGIAVSGTTVSLNTTGCSNGYVWKYNAGSFSCQADADTTYTGGTGITVSSGTISVTANSIGMDQLNPLSANSSLSNCSGASSGLIVCNPTGSVTPSSTGNCLVTAQIETSETSPAAGSYGYLYINRRSVTAGTDAAYGNSVYLTSAVTSGTTNQYNANSTYVIPVTGGTAYQFGCQIYRYGGLVDNNFNCYVSYVCY